MVENHGGGNLWLTLHVLMDQEMESTGCGQDYPLVHSSRDPLPPTEPTS